MAPPRLRVLCLHGKRQDGEIFSQRLEKLARRLEPVAEFTFVDAPFELELEEGQSVPMRSWWHDDSDDADLRAACDVIRGAHEGPFDGIIGFSQGGALAALLAASRAGGRGASLPSLAMLKFLIVAGAYAVPGFPRVALDEGLQTLHIMSVQDTCVNCSASQDLARRFPGSTTHMHEQGHCLPVRAADLDVYQAFVAQTHSPTASVNEATEEQQEELEAMKAIFMDDILECRLAPPSIKVAIRDSGAGADAAISMTLPAGYPESARELPAVKCLGMPRDLAAACQAALLEEMKANAGSPMLFQLVNYVREWLQENPTGGDAQAALGCGGSGGAGCEAEQPDDASISALLARGVDEEEALGAGAVEDMVDAATDEAARWEAAHQPAVGLSGAAESKEIARGEGGGGGLWKFTVGLVGKPSAGKSTLFNALVCPQKEDEEAKVGAFPFTTIDPNLGQGFHTVPTPEGARDIADVAAPRWGVAGNQERMVPVHILDVAGLVPGAYQGRGHGNSFLNDLCGADCLIHVVDASGSTDAGGNPLDADPGVPDPPPPTHARRGGERQAGDAGVGGGESVAGGPVGDVRWVRQEVHRWIYNNIKAKWPSVVRLGAERLVELLTGYQQSRALSLHSLARAGVELKAEAPVDFARFTPRELHRVVAHFVRVRFPMVLACNKMDHPRAPDNVRALRAAYPNEVFVPIAALYELALVRLRRDGHISYASGDAAGGIRLAPGAPGAAAAKLEAAQVAESSLLCGVLAAMEKLGGSTGVLEAINRAVSLRQPIYVFPVANLESGACEGPSPGDQAMQGGGVRGGWQPAPSSGAGGAVLRDCMMLRPGATVFEVYESLKRAPWNLVAGDFVRAEARVGASERRPLKKTDALADGTVLRIFTNKKSHWQR